MTPKTMKVAGFIAIGVVAVALILAPPQAPRELPDIDVNERAVSPGQVVDWMLTGERPVRLVDVRPEADYLENGIRGAVSLPAADISPERVSGLPAGHVLVAYGATDEDGASALKALGAYRDDVLLLSGGYDAWRAQVLEPTEPAPNSPVEAWDAYAEQMAVSNFLLGKSDTAPIPERSVVAPVLRPRSQVSSEGC